MTGLALLSNCIDNSRMVPELQARAPVKQSLNRCGFLELAELVNLGGRVRRPGTRRLAMSLLEGQLDVTSAYIVLRAQVLPFETGLSETRVM